jgi:phosphatidylglycerophosphatase A
MSNTDKPVKPKFADIVRDPALFMGFGLGSGLLTPAPGTWGTLAGWILFLPLLLLTEIGAWIVLILGLVLGSWFCQKSADYMGVHDHGSIVWDEFVGIWIVLITLPQQSWSYWIVAFLAFRVFDILKPWPIKWFDQNVEGGFGIMLDDVLAAIMASMSIWVVYYVIY